jgi:hypothetical protein
MKYINLEFKKGLLDIKQFGNKIFFVFYDGIYLQNLNMTLAIK